MAIKLKGKTRYRVAKRVIEYKRKKKLSKALSKRSELNTTEKMISGANPIKYATNKLIKRADAKKSVGFRAAKARINAGSAALQGVNKGMYRLSTARKAALKKAVQASARARKGKKRLVSSIKKKFN